MKRKESLNLTMQAQSRKENMSSGGFATVENEQNLPIIGEEDQSVADRKK